MVARCRMTELPASERPVLRPAIWDERTREDRLGLAVGHLQHVGRGGDQDLRAGELSCLSREVRVTDDRLGRRGVLNLHVEAADGSADGVLLEGAQAAAEAGDLLDRLGDDL